MGEMAEWALEQLENAGLDHAFGDCDQYCEFCEKDRKKALKKVKRRERDKK